MKLELGLEVELKAGKNINSGNSKSQNQKFYNLTQPGYIFRAKQSNDRQKLGLSIAKLSNPLFA